MSWLNTTISHARSLHEKTKGAVAQARAKLARAPGAAELEKQLEQAARNTKALPELEAMHRSWTKQIDASTQAVVGSEQRTLSFKNVLLQSCAVELSLAVIAKDPVLRKYYAFKSGTLASPCLQALHGVISRVMDCPQALWTEILAAVMDDGELLGEDHADWLIGILSALRKDWRQEVHQQGVKEITARLERSILQLQQLGTWDGVEEGDKKHRQRVETSATLLGTYKDLYHAAADAKDQEQRVNEFRQRNFERIYDEAKTYVESAKTKANGLGERHQQLQSELQRSHDGVQVTLQKMDEERAEIDVGIEKLDAAKRDIKQQIEKVTQQIQETQDGQRQHMQMCDERQRELDRVTSRFKECIKVEAGVITEVEEQEELIKCIQNVLAETHVVLEKSFTTQIEETAKKQSQFDVHFHGIIKEHLRYEQEHVKYLRKEIEHCANTLMQHKSKIDMLNVMDMSNRVVIDAAERRRVHKTIASVDSAREAFDALRSTYADFILGTEAESTTVELDQQHRLMQEMLAPCQELLSQIEGAPKRDLCKSGHILPNQTTTNPHDPTSFPSAPPRPLPTGSPYPPTAALESLEPVPQLPQAPLSQPILAATPLARGMTAVSPSEQPQTLVTTPLARGINVGASPSQKKDT